MLRTLAIAAVAMLLVGCTFNEGPDARRVSVRDRQDAAMKDPMKYSPDMPNQDISGGDIGNLDRRALKRDVDTVLNP